DRKYGDAGQLLEANGTHYKYDTEGNLVKKQERSGRIWKYKWNASGMLKEVIRPDKKKVLFEYDALGRRTSKTYQEKTTHWVWDGNTPLHEWQTEVEKPQIMVSNRKASDNKIKVSAKAGAISVRKPASITISKRQKTEQQILVEASTSITAPTITNITTWIFEPESFAPIAKMEGEKTYSIVTDYLGTPLSMLDDKGGQVWSGDLSIYGKLQNFEGKKQVDCPFRFPGQYEDEETGLYYNRFRYYDSESGEYVSQDPIGIQGNNPNIYAYVHDVNCLADFFGLIVKNLVRYKPNKVTPKPGSRQTAINRAWKEEQDLIKRTGQGTRNWTQAEIDIINSSNNSSVIASKMSNAGYTGHHINNVADFPDWKGDPRNIVFLQNEKHLSGYDEHLHGNQGHRGDYNNETKGRLIDRNKSSGC
ncbi:MAG: RHS repeat-associated core domain-containing protein, partial [Saprospiraceae bacterium]